jgi:hypothetical protein
MTADPFSVFALLAEARSETDLDLSTTALVELEVE